MIDKKYFTIMTIITLFVLICILFKKPKSSIVEVMYIDQHPSWINRLLRIVPEQYSKSIKIDTIENFNGNSLICTEQDYGFPYHRQFILTSNGNVIKIFDNVSVGQNFRFFLNIKAVNFYLEKKYQVITMSEAKKELSRFVIGRCDSSESRCFDNKEDLFRLLKNSFRFSDSTVKQLDFRNNELFIWHEHKGFLKVILQFNKNYTFKKIVINRIGFTGLEYKNL